MVCSAGGRFAGCWLGLLLLFPCLIEHAGAGWCRCVGVAGWNMCAVGSDGSGLVAGVGLAHCWVLRGHLLWCCSLVRPVLPGGLTARLSGWWLRVGGGVVVC